MAGSVNKVILIGRLGQDPKLTYLPSGSPVTEFTLATDESFKNREGQKEERTEWHRIKVFGKSAEFCSNYLSKGRLVYVEGSIRTRKWQDQQGQDRYITEIIVSGPQHTVQFMDSKGGGVAAAPVEGGDTERRAAPGGEKGKRQASREDDLAPAFPSEASGMDDVPF